MIRIEYSATKARLFGAAQYHGAHKHWAEVADIIEQLAEIEDKLLTLL